MSKSRVGRKPISIPSGVDIKMQDQSLIIKGPKGNVVVDVHPLVAINIEGGILKVGPTKAKEYSRSGVETKLKRAIIGTLRAEIDNVIIGLTKGFEKKLVLIGVGYKAQAKGKILNLTVGKSHPVNLDIPAGITIETPIPTEIIVKGIDKILVGQIAATIRDVRPPELYKGKGIRYANEVIILKETKKK